MKKIKVNFKSHRQNVVVHRLSMQERCEKQLREINARIAQINYDLRQVL